MYTIKADGDFLYFPSLANEDKSYAAINPQLSVELNKAGSLSFMILPGNRKYEDIQILKSIITVEQDGIEIFRGRVTDINTDIFLQKTVYTEGELAFLLDSIQRPYEYEGAVTALFSMLIDGHNAQVDEEKRFTVGNIMAVSPEEATHVKVSDYSDTFTEITTRILDAYGGYLKIRVEGETRYIDYVSTFDTDSAQPIAFGNNMVTLDAGGNATDIFTVLIPLGAAVKGEGGSMKPLDVTSVNGGLDYIEDAEGIAKYGRIVRTYTWSHIDNANELLSKGREYLSFGIAENATLAIRAVDMHLLDGSIDAIRLGGYVNIQAAPHGITRAEICAKIDIDLITPENTVYTFGEPKKTLTENVVQVIKKVGGGGGGGMGTGIEEETLWLERWAAHFADENEARYEILTGQIDHFNGRVSEAEILLDGVEAEVEILASEYTVLDGRISGAESSIKVNADNIELKVDKNGVISTINQSAESVKIKASKVVLSGYVTASEFNATIASLWDAEITYIDAATVDAGTVNTSFLTASSFTLANHAVKIQTLSMGSLASRSVLTTEVGGIDLSHSHAVTVEDDGTVKLGEVSATGGNFKIADTKAYKAGVAAAKASVFLSSAGWINGVNTVTASNDKIYPVELPAFSVSGGTTFNSDHKTTVYFSTASVSSPLKSVEVDASSVYEAGYQAGLAAADTTAAYAEGWAAARAEVRRAASSSGKYIYVYGPGETIDTSARFYTITASNEVSSLYNSAKATIFAQATATVKINSSTAFEVVSQGKTLTINSGML